MIRDTKAFIIGLLMMVSFCIVYAYMMTPSFGNGRNGLDYADDMFNSISKGSATAVVQGEIKKVDKWKGTEIDVSLKCKDEAQAKRWGDLYSKVEGTTVSIDNENLKIKGDLGKIFATIAEDCTSMYNNQGDVLEKKYNTDPRAATNSWYNSLKSVSKALDKKEMFKESIGIQNFMKKVIEPAYNYYGVEAKYVKDNMGAMTFLLVFYLFYTLWYGFAIYYLSIGFGITMTKAAKKSEA